ncbi:hypothetical protein LRS06_02015 [Hymenobacter sp. J193]|uniref:hypothetical protein n=1 Tax=Hymenobacter sp. J193 TaxID=2898429 RepID=UPI002151F006|nr:hypothetical protein [Hymenobacter sp. J193]MCR5886566.1 hypothetical protein [Hymenobacter sp. J193]
MAFSVNLLTTAAQCTELLADKGRERTGLVNRLNNLQFQLDNWSNVTSTAAELATTQAMIAGLQPLIDSLPEGDDRRRNQNTLLRYQARANNLAGKVEDYSATALLEKELDRDELTAEIAVLDTFIAAVTARKAAL